MSSEVGIPFATSDNALAIYNCTAALRYEPLLLVIYFDLANIISCVECVDTENACGWCLYSGICSGVSDDCAKPASVNNSFLKVYYYTQFYIFVVNNLYLHEF